MKMLYAFFAVVFLILLAFFGVWGLGWNTLFAVIIPYAAVATFVIGLVYRIIKWAKAPVPFHIPTVCGQQKSLPWIKADNIESPTSTAGLIARIALEVRWQRVESSLKGSWKSHGKRNGGQAANQVVENMQWEAEGSRGVNPPVYTRSRGKI